MVSKSSSHLIFAIDFCRLVQVLGGVQNKIAVFSIAVFIIVEFFVFLVSRSGPVIKQNVKDPDYYIKKEIRRLEQCLEFLIGRSLVTTKANVFT